ncbi:hypothetical protein JKP88DRAFT_255754 [Tribonema minus]|uniref:Uncharacterized protein n=1 Tax=Tribonema minus TaxID=303371 RepID=A0A835YZH2_9STRA|nr:hypothetical protein JKP88DRAFT_255754 [Tribonema minus]
MADLQRLNAHRLFLGSIAAVVTVLLAALLAPVIPSAEPRLLTVAATISTTVLVGFCGWVFLVTEGSPAAATATAVQVQSVAATLDDSDTMKQRKKSGDPESAPFGCAMDAAGNVCGTSDGTCETVQALPRTRLNHLSTTARWAGHSCALALSAIEPLNTEMRGGATGSCEARHGDGPWLQWLATDKGTAGTVGTVLAPLHDAVLLPLDTMELAMAQQAVSDSVPGAKKERCMSPVPSPQSTAIDAGASRKWLTATAQLLRCAPVQWLLLAHFLIWGAIIFTHSTMASFVNDYMGYETFGARSGSSDTGAAAADGSVDGGESVAPASVAIVVSQLGVAMVQVAMASAPNVLQPVRVLRASLFLAALGAAGFGIGFSALQLPDSAVFAVAFISGAGLGGLYSGKHTSVKQTELYEVMVPEVVLWLERELSSSAAGTPAAGWENMVYAWMFLKRIFTFKRSPPHHTVLALQVDSVRELSLTVSFLGAGALLSSGDYNVPRFTCGLIPLALVVQGRRRSGSSAAAQRKQKSAASLQAYERTRMRAYSLTLMWLLAVVGTCLHRATGFVPRHENRAIVVSHGLNDDAGSALFPALDNVFTPWREHHGSRAIIMAVDAPSGGKDESDIKDSVRVLTAAAMACCFLTTLLVMLGRLVGIDMLATASLSKQAVAIGILHGVLLALVLPHALQLIETGFEVNQDALYMQTLAQDSMPQTFGAVFLDVSIVTGAVLRPTGTRPGLAGCEFWIKGSPTLPVASARKLQAGTMSGMSRDVEALLDASDSDDSHGPLDLHLGSVCLEDILREDAESDDYAESPRVRTPPSRSPYASGTPPDRAHAAAAAGHFAAAPPQHAWRSSGAAAAAAAAAHSETSDALRAILQEADDDESAAAAAAAGSSAPANFNSDRGAGGRSAAAAAAAARYGALPHARPDAFPSSSSTADIDRILAAADAADAAQNGAANGAGNGAGAYGYATASGSSGSAASASRNGGAAGGGGAGAVAERAAVAAAAAAGGNEALGLGLGRVEDGGARLAAAEAREQRLLRGGNRDVISPLRVKRRMRGARGHGLGTARLDTLNQISQQLAKGMQQRGAGGAGVPTALAVHPKFIAVGTSRGLVLLFDHFQMVRRVLGDPAGPAITRLDMCAPAPTTCGRAAIHVTTSISTSTSKTEHIDNFNFNFNVSGAQVVRRVLGDPAGPAITSLDMCAGGDYLIAGNAAGGLALWDFMRGTALKTTYEAHSAPITFVHCYKHSEPAVITADAAGVVNKVAFRRVMWTAWVAETACLLDGAAGCMLSVDVLRGWAGVFSSAVPSVEEQGAGGAARPPEDAVAPFEATRLMAMSSATNTFVVSIDPQVKVIYKWGRVYRVRFGCISAAAARWPLASR